MSISNPLVLLLTALIFPIKILFHHTHKPILHKLLMVNSFLQITKTWCVAQIYRLYIISHFPKNHQQLLYSNNQPPCHLSGFLSLLLHHPTQFLVKLLSNYI